jgi:hypothetical protein
MPVFKSAREISFHQEHLLGSKEREQMYQRWEQALEDLQTLLE